MHLQELLLADDLLAVALLALVLLVHRLAAARARVARLLELLDHRPHLPQRHAHPAPAARPAPLHRAVLPALPAALAADHVARERQLRQLALVQVLERHVHAVHQVPRFARALAARLPAAEEPATAEQLAKQVLQKKQKKEDGYESSQGVRWRRRTGDALVGPCRPCRPTRSGPPRRAHRICFVFVDPRGPRTWSTP